MSTPSECTLTATEPCPTPLAWQEVCHSVSESAESRVIEFAGGEVEVVEFGAGPPLVVLPALAASPRLFFLTAWLLKDAYRVVMLGHPVWKKRPPVQRLFDETVTISAAAIRHRCPSGAPVYASSWGGQVALRMMSREPQLIHRLLLQGTWGLREFSRLEWLLLQVGRRWPGRLRRLPFWTATQLQNHRRWFPPFDETRLGFLLNELGVVPVRDAAARQLAAAVDLRADLSAVRQPVLVLRCEGDGQRTSAANDELQSLLPQARSEEMFTSGHYPYLTHPHRLVKIVRNFLTSPST
ncbi:alpha/beta fold hydrolase [Planctomicrobium sp. SH664]|uniref:alpha/beta fold hydrolase n=1 Tax=Planctomicrobium sp. SH664 TaxID=3448125 RepID=UPI003F5BB265